MNNINLFCLFSCLDGAHLPLNNRWSNGSIIVNCIIKIDQKGKTILSWLNSCITTQLPTDHRLPLQHQAVSSAWPLRILIWHRNKCLWQTWFDIGIYHWWLSWSPWCGCWYIFEDSHYITLIPTCSIVHAKLLLEGSWGKMIFIYQHISMHLILWGSHGYLAFTNMNVFKYTNQYPYLKLHNFTYWQCTIQSNGLNTQTSGNWFLVVPSDKP